MPKKTAKVGRWVGPLKRLLVPVGTLKLDPRNARLHDERNMAAITASLGRFGQQKPIVVDASNVVVAGNATLEAARALGWTHIAAVTTNLTDQERTAYAIADNRTAELGDWSGEILADLLETVDDDLIGLLDISGEELAEMMREPEPEVTEDETPAPPKKAVTKPGDLWLLGDHRLLCGDSTKEEEVERLMGKARAPLMNTDPPWGVDYCAAKVGIPRPGFRTQLEDWGNIENDSLKDEALEAFLTKAFRAAAEFALLENAAWYLWHAHLTQGFFAAAAAAAAVLLHRQIIWVKPHMVLTRSGMYHWQHEPCFYGWHRGHKPPWYGDKSQTSVWRLDQELEGRVHPTQKPVELFAIPMRNHTREGEVVYEPFSGSGSQMIAAEQLGRVCYGMEIEPRYCDVAVERWENLTGEKATRERKPTRRKKR